MKEKPTPDRYSLYLAKQRAYAAARYARLRDDPAFRERCRAQYRKWKQKQTQAS